MFFMSIKTPLAFHRNFFLFHSQKNSYVVQLHPLTLFLSNFAHASKEKEGNEEEGHQEEGHKKEKEIVRCTFLFLSSKDVL